MHNFIDNFLDRTTMYRLLFYYLVALLAIATVFGFFKILPYDPVNILFSASFIVLICFVVNSIFAKIFQAPVNAESFYLTALILVLIITPPQSLFDLQYLSLAVSASIIAMASKFIFSIKKKHIFNPAALAVAITAFSTLGSASWWIGTLCMMPFVLAGGLLITKKTIRFDLVLSFFIVAFSVIIMGHFSGIPSIFNTFYKTFVFTPILFFAFIMLTEPLTMPHTRPLRIIYGGLVGLLFTPTIHIGSIYFTPELALIVGNIFSYLVSPKQKLILILKEKIKVANGVYDFIFTKAEPLKFKPGQYLEWTIPAKNVDSRGNRRYFTIASSPTEPEVRMGVKFYSEPSSFKRQLFYIPIGGEIVASQLAGDFTLPRNVDKKLVFIAGGIGITPFRSIIKYLIDTKQKRDIVLLYSNKTQADIAYKGIFDIAKEKLGIKVIYSITDKDQILNLVPVSPSVFQGFITKEVIEKEIPDYKERKFYISGPHGMVKAFESTLESMGIKQSQIKIDFFPGLV